MIRAFPVRTFRVFSAALEGAAGSGPVAFHRTELGSILRLYGRMVAAGEWRDYAITHGDEVAVFSIFRRAAETPLYRIEKRPRLRLRQGAYAVLGEGGQVLRRGHELEQVLRVLERKLIRAVDETWPIKPR